MQPRALLPVLALALPVAACGGVALGTPSDAAAGDVGRSPARGIDSGPAPVKTVDGGTSGVDGGTTADGGSGPTKGLDASSPRDTPDGGPAPAEGGRVIVDGGPAHVDGGLTQQDGDTDATAPHGSDAGLTYVDAGYFHGDGSFFADGGAYADAGTRLDGSSAGRTDGSIGIDATPGCAPLAACCPSLTGAMQSLCDSVAAAGNGANCAAELTELESGGNCEGVSVLASELQVPPNRMVSDGTTLFFTTNETPGLLAMPVSGGPVTTLLSATVGPDFLAVDDANVYVMEPQTGLGITAGPCWNIIRVPKNGSAASLVNDPGAYVIAATLLGGSAYWAETTTPPGWNDTVLVRRRELLGGPESIVGQWLAQGDPPAELAVTSSTVFVITPGLSPSQSFSMASGAGQGLSYLTGVAGCEAVVSDTEASYCSQTTGENLRIANDGTTTSLGPAVTSSYLVFDDVYVYWADMVTVGTIMKAPKAGGGTATVIARDISPTAIAVDATSVYWGDENGYIKSVAK